MDELTRNRDTCVKGSTIYGLVLWRSLLAPLTHEVWEGCTTEWPSFAVTSHLQWGPGLTEPRNPRNWAGSFRRRTALFSLQKGRKNTIFDCSRNRDLDWFSINTSLVKLSSVPDCWSRGTLTLIYNIHDTVPVLCA